MAAFGEDQVGRVLGGRYRLIAPVGTGASATVYVADDVQLQRRVAVKVLHPSLAEDPAFLKRFRAEAQAAAALSHPNVMAVYDWGQDGDSSEGTPYLVLEYLAGGSLRAMLDRGRRLSPSQALLVGLEASRGLDYAHRRGLVHRDVKPANLLFGDDGRLRIADFGLARAIAEAAWTEPSGVVLGTARYASPEQAKGLPVDGRTDVYSLTLTLVESVTGNVPFAADTTVATLMNRLDKLMPVSAELGPLASVLERAGRPDPSERYDAGELARALVQAAERLPRPAPLPLVPIVVGRDDMTAVSPAVGVTRDLTVVGAPPTGAAAAAGGAAPVATPVPPSAATAPTAATAAATVASNADATTPTPVPGANGNGVAASSGIYDVEADKPRRKLRGFFIALAVLVVAALGAVGVLVFRDTSTPSYAVPNLVGMPLATAQNQVSENGWTINVVRARSDAQPFDSVYDQSPKDGLLKKGQTLTLNVSDGPQLHTLSDLTGKSQADAQAMLTQDKLALNPPKPEFNEDIPSGTVLRWSVGQTPNPIGQQVQTGTPVDIVVSAGPAPRTIPNLIGHHMDELVTALTQARLQYQRLDDQYSETVPVAGVISINPSPGTQVARDSMVQFVVSKGSQNVPMPDLKGQTLDQAKATLAAVELTVGQAVPPSAVNGVVVASDPPAGTPIKRGSTVNLLMH